jgi:hypothetical protein
MASPRLQLTIVAVGTVLAVTAATPASALVLCKARKGGLTVRDQCKKKELQLDAST